LAFGSCVDAVVVVVESVSPACAAAILAWMAARIGSTVAVVSALGVAAAVDDALVEAVDALLRAFVAVPLFDVSAGADGLGAGAGADCAEADEDDAAEGEGCCGAGGGADCCGGGGGDCDGGSDCCAGGGGGGAGG
jgi:hypothetical protein